MEILITLSAYYAIGFILFMITNAFIAGYNSTSLSRDDLLESLLWPLSGVMLMGTITQIVIKKIFKKG